MNFDKIKVSSMIDHTVLKANASKHDVTKICNEAIKYNFASVCINPSYVAYASELLKNNKNVKVCTVIGFPLGQSTTETKVFETKDAIAKGATEIDMVINIADLKDGNNDKILNEINEIKKVCKNLVLKVIIETALLTNQEKKLICSLVNSSNADFIKTSTGFSTGGATVEDVKLMHDICDKKLVKASGGVRTRDDALAMINAGASRLGTSNSIQIIEGDDDVKSSTNY